MSRQVSAQPFNDASEVRALARRKKAQQVSFRAGHGSRNQDSIGQRGNYYTVSQRSNRARRDGARKLGLDVKEQTHMLRANVTAIIQCGGGIWLPQTHVAVIHAGKDLAHKTGAHRLR